MRRLPGVGPRIDRISPGEHPPHGQGRGGARRLPFPSRAALPYRWVVLVHLIDGTYELFRYFLSPAAAFDRSAPEELRAVRGRSEEHTSELQSRLHLVCRLLL